MVALLGRIPESDVRPSEELSLEDGFAPAAPVGRPALGPGTPSMGIGDVGGFGKPVGLVRALSS